jgi:hypothetical protein
MHGIDNSSVPGPEGLWPLPTGIRRLLLLGPPLVLAAFTVLHPQPDLTAQAVADVSTWFMLYHLIQLPLIGLVVLSVLLLADEFGKAGTWPLRIGMGAFLVFFSAYDTLAGIGTGLAMRGTRELSAAQRDGVFEIVRDWPVFEPVAFALSIVGTLGWVVAVGYLALAVRGAGAPRIQWVCIALAALFLMVGHPAPFGTIAFGSLFVAGLDVERRRSLVSGTTSDLHHVVPRDDVATDRGPLP